MKTNVTIQITAAHDNAPNVVFLPPLYANVSVFEGYKLIGAIKTLVEQAERDSKE